MMFHKPRPETIRMISTPKVFCLKLLANFFPYFISRDTPNSIPIESETILL